MIRASLLAATALLASAAGGRAATPPPACSSAKDADPRVRCAVANPDGVLELLVQRGTSVTIEVPEGERVVATPVSDEALIRAGGRGSVRLASADDETDLPEQQQTADGNITVAVRGPTVVLKPHRDLTPQPFFVVTERDGKQTRYRFELRTVGPLEAFYSVRLRNVAQENAERRERARAAIERREAAAARDALAQASVAPCAPQTGVSLRWYGVGDRGLAPEQVCDNGVQMFVRFPGSRRVPQIFVEGPDGKENDVNESPRPDGWIAIHRRSPRIVLRDAGSALCLVNLDFDKTGRATGTGTVSSGVVRETREAAR